MEQPELVFKLSCGDSSWEALDYGVPRNLSLFFPEGSVCMQLNYGQGEGQVLIDGHEWGFYYNDGVHLDVVLHEGGLSVEEASRVVSRICARLSKQLGAEVQFKFAKRLPK